MLWAVCMTRRDVSAEARDSPAAQLDVQIEQIPAAPAAPSPAKGKLAMMLLLVQHGNDRDGGSRGS